MEIASRGPGFPQGAKRNNGASLCQTAGRRPQPQQGTPHDTALTQVQAIPFIKKCLPNQIQRITDIPVPLTRHRATLLIFIPDRNCKIKRIQSYVGLSRFSVQTRERVWKNFYPVGLICSTSSQIASEVVASVSPRLALGRHCLPPTPTVSRLLGVGKK